MSELSEQKMLEGDNFIEISIWESKSKALNFGSIYSYKPKLCWSTYLDTYESKEFGKNSEILCSLLYSFGYFFSEHWVLWEWLNMLLEEVSSCENWLKILQASETDILVIV